MSAQKKARTVKKIGTHDGAFHCDEALACWMLHRTAEFAGAEVTRTRDPEKLAAMDIVVDVGAVYDPATHRYDHHQRDFTDTLDAEHTVTRLSSAGLIYKHFGREVLQAVAGIAPGEELELLYRSVYDNLIEEVDAVDNGVSNYPADVPPKFKVATMLGQRVARLNPAWNDKTTQPDAQFLKAMAMAGEEFESVVGLYARSVLPARRLVVDALAARHAVDASGQVLELATPCPWKEHLFDLEAPADKPILYVVYPDSGGSWRIQCVPVRPAAFENRKSMPEPWRGVRDDALSQLTGVDGCIFCHATGFIGGAKTRDGALGLARLALAA